VDQTLQLVIVLVRNFQC